MCIINTRRNGVFRHQNLITTIKASPALKETIAMMRSTKEQSQQHLREIVRNNATSQEEQNRAGDDVLRVLPLQQQLRRSRRATSGTDSISKKQTQPTKTQRGDRNNAENRDATLSVPKRKNSLEGFFSWCEEGDNSREEISTVETKPTRTSNNNTNNAPTATRRRRRERRKSRSFPVGLERPCMKRTQNNIARAVVDCPPPRPFRKVSLGNLSIMETSKEFSQVLSTSSDDATIESDDFDSDVECCDSPHGAIASPVIEAVDDFHRSVRRSSV